MVQLILAKVTVHLVLHIATTERRECDAMPGMMWAAQAVGGRSGQSRVHVWVDCTLLPLARWAMRGAAAGSIFVMGASVVRKWLVAPDGPLFDGGSIGCYGLEEDIGYKGIVMGGGWATSSIN
jgi:hypothetical protein